MASLVFSPGVKQAADAPLPPCLAVDNELVLARFASTKIDCGKNLQCGVEVTASLLLRNETDDAMDVSFRANRQAAKQLALPAQVHIDASCSQAVEIKFTPALVGDQRLQFEVVTSVTGRLQVQLFACVVSLGATAAVTQQNQLAFPQTKQGAVPSKTVRHDVCMTIIICPSLSLLRYIPKKAGQSQ